MSDTVALKAVLDPKLIRERRMDIVTDNMREYTGIEVRRLTFRDISLW